MPRAIGITGTIISALLIAAHNLRAGSLLLVAVSLAFPLILVFRQPWATRIVQLLLVAAAAEWLHTLLVIAEERHAAAEPWHRMAVILGLVFLFTLGSAITVRERKRAL